MDEDSGNQSDEAGFMQRWSRRKLDAQSEDEQVLEVRSDPEDITSTEPEVEEYKTDDDMPPIEQLTEKSDYSDFLSPGVSDVLRKQALRKMFHMPSMNIVDGLDDYAEDFNDFTALGDIITHEMQRMFDREKEKARLAAEAELAAESEAAEKADVESVVDEVQNPTSTLNADYVGDDGIQSTQLSVKNPELAEMAQDYGLINYKDKTKNEKLT